MFKNRLELVKNMMQMIPITFIFMCKWSTATGAFQVRFWLFLNVLYGFPVKSGAP